MARQFITPARKRFYFTLMSSLKVKQRILVESSKYLLATINMLDHSEKNIVSHLVWLSNCILRKKIFVHSKHLELHVHDKSTKEQLGN